MRYILLPATGRAALAARFWQPSIAITIVAVHFRVMPSQQSKVTAHVDLYEVKKVGT